MPRPATTKTTHAHEETQGEQGMVGLVVGGGGTCVRVLNEQPHSTGSTNTDRSKGSGGLKTTRARKPKPFYTIDTFLIRDEMESKTLTTNARFQRAILSLGVDCIFASHFVLHRCSKPGVWVLWWWCAVSFLDARKSDAPTLFTLLSTHGGVERRRVVWVWIMRLFPQSAQRN